MNNYVENKYTAVDVLEANRSSNMSYEAIGLVLHEYLVDRFPYYAKAIDSMIPVMQSKRGTGLYYCAGLLDLEKSLKEDNENV